MFVDPRSHPSSDTRTSFSRTTGDPDALIELHRLCRDGRLYEVEDWIRTGHPLQFAKGVVVKGRFSLVPEGSDLHAAMQLLATQPPAA